MKKIIVLAGVMIMCLLFSGCEGNGGYYGMGSMPPLVEQWREDVKLYADIYGIPEYVDMLLAIIAQESGGDAENTPDIMQCSASKGLPDNTISDPVESIQQGICYFSGLLKDGRAKGVDMDAVIQSYNFGGGYQDYIEDEWEGKHSESAARAFSSMMCGRYGYSFYGDVLYVEHVKSFLASEGDILDEGVYASMQEGIQEYMGVPYLYGGNGTYGIDCSALMQKLYKSAGWTLPRTAQAQYDAVTHIADYEAEPGDLVFFYGSYENSARITHVGLYVGDGKMFHASAGKGCCCYSSIETQYYRSHMAGFGRP